MLPSELDRDIARMLNKGNRFDVLSAGVLYFATQGIGAYAETLARFRPSAKVRQAVADEDEDFLLAGHHARATDNAARPLAGWSRSVAVPVTPTGQDMHRPYTRSVPIIDRVRERLPPKYREMAKFLVVGGTSWIVDTGLFTLMTHTFLAEKGVTAKAISILVSTVLSYVLNREWSFNTRGGRETHHEATLFFLINGLALGLNLIPLAISRHMLGFNPGEATQWSVTVADFISANVIGTLIGMVFRYWAYRRFVFPEDFGVKKADREDQDELSGPTGPIDPEAPRSER